MQSTLRLGTRRSLLAWAQSSWVARQIERLNPGTTVELVGIDTRGDKILDVSLQSVEGKEFFVAELDDALRSARVDFTVHSMKDLSLDRPKEFVLGCIPKRENPRDVVLFGPGIFEKIAAGKKLRVGTSSPRRLENIPAFLARALPRVGGRSAELEFTDIRGNVNTRLARVHESEDSPRHLDAVVLAFAGLIRLSADEAGGAELRKLLEGVRWMVLPLRECPAAPAQGALAVECRADDARVRAALEKLHDPATAERVASERQLLADWGGGCHQKFGATAITPEETGRLLFIRGKKPDGVFVDDLRWRQPPAPKNAQAWDGLAWRKKAESAGTESRGVQPALEKAAFVAHWRAWPEGLDGSKTRIWTSGTGSWFKLAEAGLWVEGSAESLGFDLLAPTLSEKVLNLPSLENWTILTHEDAASGWKVGHVATTYRIAPQAWSPEAKKAISEATHVFWSSGSEFEELGSLARKDAHHACGAGKTAARLREAGLKPTVFPSHEEWKKWLGL